MLLASQQCVGGQLVPRFGTSFFAILGTRGIEIPVKHQPIPLKADFVSGKERERGLECIQLLKLLKSFCVFFTLLEGF